MPKQTKVPRETLPFNSVQRTALEKGVRSRYLDGIAQGNSSSEEDSVTDNSQKNDEVGKNVGSDATRNAIASEEDGAGGNNEEEEDVDLYD